MPHILLELAHAWVQAVKAALFSISAHHFLSIACFPACMNCCKKRKRVAAREVPWDHLVVTDVRWASPPSSSSGSFYETFWELSRLGVILQEGVDAFDFMSCLARNTQISLAARQHGFDVIVMYGVNFGVFDQTDGSLDCQHPVSAAQYAQSHRLPAENTPQTKVFHEAVLGQDPHTTIVNIHAENHQRYFLSASSMAYLRLRYFNPSRLRMQTGAQNRVSHAPLVGTITSNSLYRVSKYMRKTESMEEQFDLCSCLLDTLTAGGHVLILGAGRLEICRELVQSAGRLQNRVSPPSGALRRATSLTEPGLRTKSVDGPMVTYWDHCLHDGEVIFKHVMDWTLSSKFGWSSTGVRAPQIAL